MRTYGSFVGESSSPVPPPRYRVGDRVMWITKVPFNGVVTRVSPFFSHTFGKPEGYVPRSQETYIVTFRTEKGTEITAAENELEGHSDYFRRLVAVDPDFVRSDFFRVHAPREVKEEHPEHGFDFGFFDAVRESSSPSPLKFRVGDPVCWPVYSYMVQIGTAFGIVADVLSPSRRVYDVHLVTSFVRGVVGRVLAVNTPKSESEIEGTAEFFRRKVAEDPMFVTTELFRRYAPRDIKAEYPEAGGDFGFFDTKGMEP